MTLAQEEEFWIFPQNNVCVQMGTGMVLNVLFAQAAKFGIKIVTIVCVLLETGMAELVSLASLTLYGIQHNWNADVLLAGIGMD